ncbi:glutamine--fructose-6-phosphate transaminase (isomerizing), partial [Candidatus Dojkabacteria bacterium]|nr:glutamine--fructose-6-phosphate transaminase (isomerizing) [Candidatus Dojkabacteria bacterium]
NSDTSIIPHVGVGHTRWATHGGVTTHNAHPHFSADESFVLAQNGIVENYQKLKEQLKSLGHSFKTETDTEVIVRMVEEKLKDTDSLQDAVRKGFLELDGRNTIIVLSSDGEEVIAIRNGSPLVVGVGDENEYFFASDTLSFADKTDKVAFIENHQMVVFSNGSLHLFDVKTGEKLSLTIETLDHGNIEVNKEGYDHYMLKEVFEQRYTIKDAVGYESFEFDGLIEAIQNAGRVFTLGSGGAFYAADQVAYFLRSIAGVMAQGLRPYEIESYVPLIQDGDVLIIISQSGETADNLEALELLKEKDIVLASVVNMIGSTTSRISKFPFLSRTGPELCVLSTKSGSAQTSFGYMLGNAMIQKYDSARKSVHELAGYLESEYLTEEFSERVRKIAVQLKDKEHIFLLGKGRNYQNALVGALNIKEASYIHAEGFAAGELKHGVIALIEEGTPVISFVDDDSDHDYMIGATAEVKARGAHVIGLGVENNELFDEFIPLPTQSGIDAAVLMNIVPCQLLAYHLAVLRGYNPDKPRNLAKSVTVK